MPSAMAPPAPRSAGHLPRRCAGRVNDYHAQGHHPGRCRMNEFRSAEALGTRAALARASQCLAAFPRRLPRPDDPQSFRLLDRRLHRLEIGWRVPQRLEANDAVCTAAVALTRSGGQLVAQRLTTCALQQVVSYLGYSGHQINVVVAAARDPIRSAPGKLAKNRR
jgi:hypothetical protein